MSDKNFHAKVALSSARMAATSALWLGIAMTGSVAGFILVFATNEPAMLVAGGIGGLVAIWNFIATFSYLRQHLTAISNLTDASP